MKYLRMFFVLLLLISSTAQAENIHIRFWLPYAAGGPGDQQLRLWQKILQDQNPGWTTSVEFRPGAGGGVGQVHFAKLEKSDQIELLFDAPNLLINKYLTKSHSLDLHKDFTILMPLGNLQVLILVPSSSTVNNIQDLRAMKKNPLIYASSGIGSVSHLTSVHISSFINKQTVHVPYKGVGPLYPDLIAGRIDFASVLFNGGIEQVAIDKVKAIGITGYQRHPRLPNVKTLNEQGIKNLPINPWYALFSHPKNDPEKLKKVQQALTKILLDKNIQKNTMYNYGIVIDEEAVRNPQIWFDQQIKQFQVVINDPKYANLE